MNRFEIISAYLQINRFKSKEKEGIITDLTIDFWHDPFDEDDDICYEISRNDESYSGIFSSEKDIEKWFIDNYFRLDYKDDIKVIDSFDEIVLQYKLSEAYRNGLLECKRASIEGIWETYYKEGIWETYYKNRIFYAFQDETENLFLSFYNSIEEAIQGRTEYNEYLNYMEANKKTI